MKAQEHIVIETIEEKQHNGHFYLDLYRHIAHHLYMV